MITDNLKNIDKYPSISKSVKDFLLTLDTKTPAGHYEIDENSYANIDIYETKSVEICKFEAHKKYIDIQMLLEGEEELDYISTSGLEISEQYDEKRDVMFFKNPEKASDTLHLEPFKFAVIYPHEAHRPQMSTGKNIQKVKKVVVKILL